MDNLPDDEKEMITEAVEESEPIDKDPAWIKYGEEDEYEFELFLSTDGKNTVRVKTNNPKARKKAMIKAVEAFEYIKTRYGTKQAQAVKEYSKEKPVDDKEKQDNCPHTNFKFTQSHTDKNPGRWFKQCQDCKKFLGWQS